IEVAGLFNVGADLARRRARSRFAWQSRQLPSLSAPTLLAELVRRYAIADVCVFVGLAKAPPLRPGSIGSDPDAELHAPMSCDVEALRRSHQVQLPFQLQVALRGCLERASSDAATIIRNAIELDRSLPHFSFSSRCLIEGYVENARHLGAD